MNIFLHNCDYRTLQILKDVFLITDPPYNQGCHYNHYPDRLTQSEYDALIEPLYHYERFVLIQYPEFFVNSTFGRKCEEVVSWVYPSNTAKQSRLICWYGCKPDFSKIPQPYRNPTDKRIAKLIAEGKMCKSYDWWNINQVKNVSKKDNPHPCPMPLEVMIRIIKSTTNADDTVFDPFMGSGTTGIAAVQLGRNFIGTEIDSLYFEYAERQIQLAKDAGPTFCK